MIFPNCDAASVDRLIGAKISNTIALRIACKADSSPSTSFANCSWCSSTNSDVISVPKASEATSAISDKLLIYVELFLSPLFKTSA